MRYILKPLNAIIDSCFAWFTPGWRRKGHEARAALTRYCNYNKPTLTEERAQQYTTLLNNIKEALLYWKKQEVIELTEKIKSQGEGLDGFNREVALEIIESFFVIMVVFLGIRTYYLQPFRIPTGSMQPTLNGITIHDIEEKDIPAAPQRWLEAVTHGSEYVNIKIDSPKTIVDMRTEQYLLLFTRTVITFSDGSKETIPCAEGALADYFLEKGIIDENGVCRSLRPGETLICARLDAGDMVVVNRMAYHFRKPELGETFVFDTRGINTNTPQAMPDQSNASHFIKRLCGLPGDKLEIQTPHLIINGEIAKSPYIQRVAACQEPYNSTGYNKESRPVRLDMPGMSQTEKASNARKYYFDKAKYDQLCISEDKPVMTLSNSPSAPNLREYAALGDNTKKSKDSRYWGPVRQFNILGPAVFTVWPFSSHWGSIE
ncbi:MAG: signal peptidase I [Akkermansiaceae bacterium]|nr:signal peptidase I [Akkermansiaceae bacterium]